MKNIRKSKIKKIREAIRLLQGHKHWKIEGLRRETEINYLSKKGENLLKQCEAYLGNPNSFTRRKKKGSFENLPTNDEFADDLLVEICPDKTEKWKEQFFKEKTIYIATTEGCVFHCVFCLTRSAKAVNHMPFFLVGKILRTIEKYRGRNLRNKLNWIKYSTFWFNGNPIDYECQLTKKNIADLQRVANNHGIRLMHMINAWKMAPDKEFLNEQNRRATELMKAYLKTSPELPPALSYHFLYPEFIQAIHALRRAKRKEHKLEHLKLVTELRKKYEERYFNAITQLVKGLKKSELMLNVVERGNSYKDAINLPLEIKSAYKYQKMARERLIARLRRNKIPTVKTDRIFMPTPLSGKNKPTVSWVVNFNSVDNGAILWEGANAKKTLRQYGNKPVVHVKKYLLPDVAVGFDLYGNILGMPTRQRNDVPKTYFTIKK
jgi:hypothetical protein